MKKDYLHEIIRSVLIIAICSISMFNCSENISLNRENEQLKVKIQFTKEALSKSETIISRYSKANDSLNKLVRNKYVMVILESKDVNDGKR
jgi:hypothetical protein